MSVKRPLDETEKPVIVADVAPKISYIPLKTGLCYDVRMRYHAKIYTSYFEYIDPHPEDPRRIYRIYKILVENGLIQDPSLSGIDEIGDLMLKLPVREASRDEILQVHSQEHLDYIESTVNKTREELLKETEAGDSIYFNHDSCLSAKLSCGGAIEACRAVVEGKVKNSLAIVRPPGHHAEPHTPGGFCLFSNVAVAAKNMLKNYPETVRKIMVVDWDVHHGNGTQAAFWDDPSVLYVSLHRYEQGKYYPGTKAGSMEQVGGEGAAGFNINIPWPTAGMTDADYIHAFQRVVMPIGYEYQPDLVIISSGFDAADGDTIGQCHVSPQGYSQMTHMLKSLARGQLCVVLEGGYNLDSIAVSALAVAKVLVGEPPEEISNQQPCPESIETVAEVTRTLAPYWKSMRAGSLGIDFTVPSVSLETSIMNSYASLHANMVELPLTDALVTPDVYENDTLVVLLHETPDVYAEVNPVTGIISSEKSQVVDPTHRITSFFREKYPGWAMMSVHVTNEEQLTNIWDNYMQYFKATRIALIGIGNSYDTAVSLLGHRQDPRIKCMVAYLKESQHLKAIVGDDSADWYYKNSLLFIGRAHPCWKQSGQRARKKFGRCIKSECSGLEDVINDRLEEGMDFVLDSFEEWSDSE